MRDTQSEAIRKALAITPRSSARERTIDITTTGARSGRKRRIEIWFYRVENRVYLSSQPAVRDWYANLIANPEFTFHLKHGIQVELAAVATPVLDLGERRRIFAAIVADLNQLSNPARIPQPVEPVDNWVERSPLMLVEFAGASLSVCVSWPNRDSPSVCDYTKGDEASEALWLRSVGYARG